MVDKTSILLPDATYHVYNRANGSEKLFLSDDNYRYFLRKYQFYISPIANTFCYCLMPNHFHFLIQIKSESELNAYFSKDNVSNESKTLSDLESLTGLELSKKLSQQFSNLFNGYTQAFNKQQKRKGSLFMRPFKRIQISDEKYLLNLILYIHQNPLEARLCSKLQDWKHSSYQAIISKQRTFIEKEYMIDCFDNLGNFIYCHTAVVVIENSDF